MCWMLIGVVLGSVITASVTESMSSTVDFKITKDHKVCMMQPKISLMLMANIQEIHYSQQGDQTL